MNCIWGFREGLKANADVLVNLEGLDAAAQVNIESENSTLVTFIDGTLSFPLTSVVCSPSAGSFAMLTKFLEDQSCVGLPDSARENVDDG